MNPFPKGTWAAVSVGLVAISSHCSRAESLSERLGYSAQDKILILHADDMGSIESANTAIEDAFTYGLVKSASVMAPCPATPAVVKRWLRKPDADLGIHVTLTSEWDSYRWGPIAGSEVPSLTEDSGYMPPTLFSLYMEPTARDVEREIRAQIEYFLDAGVSPTHIDTHMGAVFLKRKWFDIYLNLAQEYRIPPMYPRWTSSLETEYGKMGAIMSVFAKNVFGPAERHGFLPIDYLDVQAQGDTYEARKENIRNSILNLKPGVTQLIVHPAYANAEFKEKIMSKNPGEIARDWEAKIAQDPEIRALIESMGVHVIGWKDIERVYPWDQVRKMRGLQ